eukprot:TRINITY_DN3589_c0_g1_i1.p1 TRINITY_DN3589_c0_g1~~TRINITY_DN3589_c0_g1_i1.p1  ORF type:complete len:703 (+),score=158.69 TRINITY_DN3589_c0_g1_i1:205-2313(+)
MEATLDRGLLEDGTSGSSAAAATTCEERSRAAQAGLGGGRQRLIAQLLAAGLGCALCFYGGSSGGLRKGPGLALDSLSPEQVAGAEGAALLASGDNVWHPGKRPAWQGQAFETRVDFLMPYMDFAEDIYIHADEPRGLMRLSYYNGANTFYTNVSGSSWQIIPVVRRLTCLQMLNVTKLEKVIPDMDVFIKEGTMKLVDLHSLIGKHTLGYEFTMETKPKHVAKDSDSKFFPPDNERGTLYAGVYKFYVDPAEGGKPVQLSFKGHNGLFLTGHKDEYTIVYKAFYARPEGIDNSFFSPPQGMPCAKFQNPTGPVMQQRPHRDFAMAFPGALGDRHRSEVLTELWGHLNKTCTSVADCASREHLSLHNFRLVHAMNRRGRGYQLGINHMIDWTPEEMKALLGRRKVQPTQLEAMPPMSCLVYQGPGDDWKNAKEVPKHIDYRENGLAGPVRDQGTCGCCWAMGAIAMLEGQLAKATGKVTALSEQHLMDCTWSFGNLACDGGEDLFALDWAIQRNRGHVATKSTYGRFLSQDGFCHFDESRGVNSNNGLANIAEPQPGAQNDMEFVTLRSCWALQLYPDLTKIPTPQHPMHTSEEANKRLAITLSEIGPLSISINAGLFEFGYYASGVYDSPLCKGTVTDLDHTVLLVGHGYDEESGQDYWLVRNSWSTWWGEAGYIRIAKKDNTCGVTTSPTFALLEGSLSF